MRNADFNARLERQTLQTDYRAMKKALLAGVAVLFLATGATHAGPRVR